LAVLEFHLTRSTLQHPRRARAQVLGMAAQRVLAGAAALLAIAPAAGLGTRLAQPLGPNGRAAPPDDELRKRDLTSDEDLVAAGKDADEDDDFDTWYFKHAGEDIPQRISAGGPEKHKPDSNQKYWVAEATSQCKAQTSLENGVITYLVTRPSDLERLKSSAPHLRSYVLKRWAYDVKVFIPDYALRKYDSSSFGNSPTSAEVSAVMLSELGKDYNWEVVPFNVEFPKVIADDHDWKSKMNGCAKAVSTSYKHMNQFFTKAMYELPALDKYRYYMRIDADFDFNADLQADPFCMMAKSNRKFMWQTRKRIGNSDCSDGLFEWFDQYRQTQGLTAKDPIFFREHGARVNYVGYVGMGDLDFFRSEKVRKLAEAFNADGRIYLNRWSDQTYYVLLFALFEEHNVVGDIGFDWPADAWCHKCAYDDDGRRVKGEEDE